MYHIERIRPHVALCPALFLACPGAARVSCFHEACVGVEDGEGRDHRAVMEEGCVGRAVQERGKDRDSVVIVCTGR